MSMSYHISFNGNKYCHIFVKYVFLVQVMIKYLVLVCLENKQARSFRVRTRQHTYYLMLTI